MIQEKRLLENFLKLVKIDSPTRRERAVADVLSLQLTALGLQVQEDEVGGIIGGNSGNLIAFLPANTPGTPSIMFSAHMDCVEPCQGVVPVVKDGRITSSGNTVLGGDDKAGLAAILEGLHSIIENNVPHGDIQVLFTVSEEGGLNGAKHIAKQHLKTDLGYVLDSSGAPGEIITAAPGQCHVAVVVHGKAAHAGIAPEEGHNAIVAAGCALARIKQGRIDEETTANIGIIKGGHATNIVPNRVEVLAEARSRNREKLLRQSEHMKETFEQAALENGCQAEVKIETAYEAFVLAADSQVVKLALQAAQSVGIKPVLGATGGGSDANYFNKYGVPTAVLGIGMSKVHTTDEYITESDLYNSARLVVGIIEAAAVAKTQ